MILSDRGKKTAKYVISWAILILSLILFSSSWTCSTKNLTGTDKTGSIFVKSVPPGAEIYLDGDSTGNQTPHTLFDVRVGNHVVSVKMDGYLSSPPDSLIRVDEGKIDTVEFVLLKTSYGSLKVSSNVDGATICIDKKPKDEVTPHVFFNSVPVGTHIISIFKEGYSNENPAKEIVTITTGDTAEVHLTLNPTELGKAVGNITPDFDLQDADLFRHRLYAYRGFVSIINFWAEDCTYCMEELPHLQEIYTEYRSDSLIIFGINYGGDFGQEGFDVIRRIRDDKQLDFILLKGAGTDVKSDYDVTSTPVTIILDRGGKIYYYIVGFYSPLPGKLRQKLDELFGK